MDTSSCTVPDRTISVEYNINIEYGRMQILAEWYPYNTTPESIIHSNHTKLLPQVTLVIIAHLYQLSAHLAISETSIMLRYPKTYLYSQSLLDIYSWIRLITNHMFSILFLICRFSFPEGCLLPRPVYLKTVGRHFDLHFVPHG